MSTTSKTKSELLADIDILLSTNAELTKNNDELRIQCGQYHDLLAKKTSECEELKKMNKRLWKMIDMGIDLKKLLDDAEDIAEDLRDCVASIYSSDEEDDED